MAWTPRGFAYVRFLTLVAIVPPRSLLGGGTLEPVPSAPPGIELPSTPAARGHWGALLNSASLLQVEPETGTIESVAGKLTAPAKGSADLVAATFVEDVLGTPTRT